MGLEADRWIVVANGTGKYRLRNAETGEWYMQNHGNGWTSNWKPAEWVTLELAQNKAKEISWVPVETVGLSIAGIPSVG